ncbi:MAG: hypothetical protein ACREOI_31495 [bacterium]
MFTTIRSQFSAVLLLFTMMHTGFAGPHTNLQEPKTKQAEHPQLVELIERDLRLQQTPDTITVTSPAKVKQETKEEPPKKKRKWPLIVIGGATVGIVTVLLLSTGDGEEKPASSRGLPRPPNVP